MEPADEQTLRFYGTNAPAYAEREITSRQTRLGRFLALLSPVRPSSNSDAARAPIPRKCWRGVLTSHRPTARRKWLKSPRAALAARSGRLLFHDLDAVEAYDGVWANACLLHVPRPELAQVLALIWRALKPGGIFYASFKAGDAEGRDTLNRYYNYPSPDWLRDQYARAGNWTSLEIEAGDVMGFDNEWAPMLFIVATKNV